LGNVNVIWNHAYLRDFLQQVRGKNKTAVNTSYFQAEKVKVETSN